MCLLIDCSRGRKNPQPRRSLGLRVAQEKIRSLENEGCGTRLQPNKKKQARRITSFAGLPGGSARKLVSPVLDSIHLLGSKRDLCHTSGTASCTFPECRSR